MDKDTSEHIDAVSYLNISGEERAKFYKISNIKKCLDELDNMLFYQFLKIMVFDALVGEQDRHEENWGIIRKEGTYKLSPLYDNGCNLLREFKNEEHAQKYYSGVKDFNSYIKRSKTIIYKEDSKDKYKHFELIKYLNDLYPKEMQAE